MEIGLLVNWLCVEAQHCNKIGDISNVFATILGTVVALVGGYIIGNKKLQISKIKH